LLGDNTRFFDCLVGYFFITGFHKLCHALTKTERVRILIGIKADRTIYELLAQIARGKRIVLVSATPLNNTPRDILSQIKLFQPGHKSTIPNVRNLRAFFGKMQQRLKGPDRQLDRDVDFRTLRENARQAREKILKFRMIRRTRAETEHYYGEDLKKATRTNPA